MPGRDDDKATNASTSTRMPDATTGGGIDAFAMGICVDDAIDTSQSPSPAPPPPRIATPGRHSQRGLRPPASRRPWRRARAPSSLPPFSRSLLPLPCLAPRLALRPRGRRAARLLCQRTAGAPRCAQSASDVQVSRWTPEARTKRPRCLLRRRWARGGPLAQGRMRPPLQRHSSRRPPAAAAPMSVRRQTRQGVPGSPGMWGKGTTLSSARTKGRRGSAPGTAPRHPRRWTGSQPHPPGAPARGKSRGGGGGGGMGGLPPSPALAVSSLLSPPLEGSQAAVPSALPPPPRASPLSLSRFLPRLGREGQFDAPSRIRTPGGGVLSSFRARLFEHSRGARVSIVERRTTATDRPADRDTPLAASMGGETPGPSPNRLLPACCAATREKILRAPARCQARRHSDRPRAQQGGATPDALLAVPPSTSSSIGHEATPASLHFPSSRTPCRSFSSCGVRRGTALCAEAGAALASPPPSPQPEPNAHPSWPVANDPASRKRTREDEREKTHDGRWQERMPRGLRAGWKPKCAVSKGGASCDQVRVRPPSPATRGERGNCANHPAARSPLRTAPAHRFVLCLVSTSPSPPDSARRWKRVVRSLDPVIGRSYFLECVTH